MDLLAATSDSEPIFSRLQVIYHSSSSSSSTSSSTIRPSFAATSTISSSSFPFPERLCSSIPAHSTMIYAVAIFIVIIFLITTITYITWLVWHYFVVAPPIQPELNAEIEINNAMLSTWPTLTYAEAKSRDPRAVNAICCSICFVDYEEEEGEDKALRLLPECGYLFHATCVDPWLWRRQTCPTCRSLVVNQDMQTSLAELFRKGKREPYTYGGKEREKAEYKIYFPVFYKELLFLCPGTLGAVSTSSWYQSLLPGETMADGNPRNTPDADRSVEALWREQTRIARQLDELNANFNRFTVEVRQAIQANRGRGIVNPMARHAIPDPIPSRHGMARRRPENLAESAGVRALLVQLAHHKLSDIIVDRFEPAAESNIVYTSEAGQGGSQCGRRWVESSIYGRGVFRRWEGDLLSQLLETFYVNGRP
ncbi:hypothetical protein M5K25_025532 [Dendrobium thyrsiflorum]|uniref:RING-type domain-containing protein n=1 Tax=Dendrobium thyrsiflorum TaxID=117978 RepID=A0ABD0U9F9_DENTH